MSDFLLELKFEMNPEISALPKIFKKIENLNIENKKKVIWIYTKNEKKILEIEIFLSEFFNEKDKNNQENYFYKSLFFNNLQKEKNTRKIDINKLITENELEIKDKKTLEKILLENFCQNFYQEGNFEINNAKRKKSIKNIEEIEENFIKKKFVIKDNEVELISNQSQFLFNEKEEKSEEEEKEEEEELNFKNSNKITENFEIYTNCLLNSSDREKFIHKIKPNYIILLEPNVIIIRELLIYQKKLKKIEDFSSVYVYSLMIKNSFENEIYLENITQENNSFEKIIKERQNLPFIDEPPENTIKKINFSEELSTRIGGSLRNSSKKPLIIVDTREFKSSLPSFLFYEGFLLFFTLIRLKFFYY